MSEILSEGRECYEEYFIYLKEKNLLEVNLKCVVLYLNGLLRFYNLID